MPPGLAGAAHATVPVAALALALALVATPAARAEANPYAGWVGQAGLPFVGGTQVLRARIAANHPQQEVRALAFAGPDFALYRMSAGGVGAGVSLGPLLVSTGGVRHAVLPVAAGARVEVARIATHRAYVGVAAERLLADGDVIAGGRTGAAFTLGVEYLKPAGVGWGMQAGLHTADVRVPATAFGPERRARPGVVRWGAFFRF
jgi:hypothetical protein